MRVRIALAGLLVFVGLIGLGPARAETNQECTNNDDITVVVDFQELGGGVNVRCAPQPVKDGFDALSRADISYLASGAFLCRIADKPNDIPCNQNPPATYYWTYWIASRGDTWCYSQSGAAGRQPPPGTIEGWSFFKKTSERPKLTPPRYPVPGVIPGTTPNQLSASDCDRPVATTTTTTATQATAPHSEDPTPTTQRGAAPTVATTAVGRTDTTASVAPAGDSTTSSTGPIQFYVVRDNTTSSIPLGDDDLSLKKTSKDKGPPWGTIAGAGVIVGLGAAAVVLRRRNFFG